jgi:transposase InsO family protein
MNHKKVYRLYREERLMVRRRGGRKRALGSRTPTMVPAGINQRWSLDFVSDTLSDGRRFRILAIVDDFNRECLMVVDTSLGGVRVARELERLALERSTPQISVSDNVLRQQSRFPSEQRSPVACGASGFDSAVDRWGAAWSANSLRCGGPQGFARCARRPTPPLTAASASAEQVVSREPRLPS